MRIIKNDYVYLKRIYEATKTQSLVSEIIIAGTKIKLNINGADLEACIEYDNRYLVFTTNDCPFEESLNIYLLSSENEIIDNATVFWPYCTGSFKLLRIVEPDLVQFTFFGNKYWQIEIFDNRRFYIPYISEPSGVWRRVKLWRFFGVSEVSSKEGTGSGLSS